MSGPSLKFGLPPPSLFKFPPDPEPPALPPPSDAYTFKAPFPIPADVYNNVLSFAWPATIASVYAATVFMVNAYNRSHGNQPWRISKTRLFRAFVIFHNVFLAVYSGVTCVAMVRALKRALPRYDEENALVGTVDALCKIQGPRGLGDAVTYNSTNNAWGATNKLIHLGLSGLPDSTDVGRIWNEGLAWWGWWFYLSKFYEVLDTFIILAKGKRSTTLQTYHHAGAMLCMWAGIRYMSAPIWMFALVNSGIHTMMYTYYTLSALHFRVPQAVKRTLTSLQILQFIVGASFAAVHLFISYTIPVSVAHLIPEAVASVTSVVSEVSETASSVFNEATVATATATATAGAVGSFLKQAMYRAAGEEGLAQNVLKGRTPIQPIQQDQQVHHHPVAQKLFHHEPKQTVVYRTHYQEVHCIDTTGQSFAVWLNLIYLFPLTGLFVRFFVKSYLRRTSSSTKHPTRRRSFGKSGADAARGVQREIESLGRSVEDGEIKVAKKIKNKVKEVQDGKAEQTTKDMSPPNDQHIKKASLDAARDVAKDIIRSASQSPRRGRQDTRNDLKDSYAEVKLEDDEKAGIIADSKIEPLKDESAQTNGNVKKEEESGDGLSTSNPNDSNLSYADKIKKENQ